jgi:opacity protein-like surface antigen
MKKIARILFASSVMFSQALAQDQVLASEILPYIRLDSGWARFQRVDGLSTGENTSKLKSKTNNIVGAGLGLGINWGDKVRSDITWFHHLHPKLSSEHSNSKVIRRPLIDAYFFNIYYETGIKICLLNPYIGVGAGLASVKDKLSYITNNKGLIESASYIIKRKNNFAYKLTVGSAFDLNDRVKFDLAYNYHDYGRARSSADLLNRQIGKTTHYRAHIISAGLRFGL